MALVAFMIIHSVNKKRTAKKEFENFYNSHVEGTLESVSGSLGTTYIRLNTEKRFQLWVYTSTPGNKIFHQVADVGDLVRKTAKSDTLYLYKKDAVYAFTFSKFE